MSYGLFGKILNAKTKEVLAACNLDFLKNLNEMRYSSRFADIDGIYVDSNDEKIKEALKYDTYDYEGMAKKSDLESRGIKYHKGWSEEMCEGYFIEEDTFTKEELESLFITLDINDYVKNRQKYEEEYASVYIHHVKYEDATFYNKECFEKGEKIISQRLSERKAELQNLKNIKNSIEWYKLDDKAQERIFEDIADLEETVEEYTWQEYSVNKIINILEFYEEDVAEYMETEEFAPTYDKYKWDKRDIVVAVIVD